MIASPRLLTHRNGLFFINKPTGWSTHRTAEGGPDLVGWLTEQGKLLRDVRPVHRLDLDTSGVIVCADKSARARASRYFESREARKHYTALAFGRLQPTGTVSVEIDGKKAVTEITLVETFTIGSQPVSLLSLTPKTGRRHQIRRHLHYIHHPILGDRRYSRKGIADLPGQPPRMWLHADSLTLPDHNPVTSPLPAMLQAHLDVLRAAAQVPV